MTHIEEDVPSKELRSDEPALRDQRRRDAIIAAVVVAICIAIGLYLRLGYFSRVNPSPDSDEAEGGLMAHELLKGEFPLLLWGQAYGGTAWIVPIAFSLRAFGMTPLGLRLPAVLGGALSAYLMYRVAIEAGWNRARAAVTGAVFWTYPLSGVLVQTRDAGYFNPALISELVVLALVLRVDRNPPASTGLRFLLGLTMGLGIWINPGVVYIVLPAGGWLAAREMVRHRTFTRSWTIARSLITGWSWTMFGAVVGASPWWFLALLRVDTAAGKPEDPGFTIGGSLRALVTQQLPGVLGVKPPRGGLIAAPWQHGWFSVLLFAALATLLVVQVLRSFRAEANSLFGTCAFFLPLVFVAIATRTGPIYDNLRYIFLATPIIVLLVGLGWRRDLSAIAVLSVLPVLSIASFESWAPREPDPRLRVDAVQKYFQREKIPCAVSDYWAGGNRLMFALGGEVPIASLYAARNDLYVEKAESGGVCAWVFYDGWNNERAFRAWIGNADPLAVRNEVGEGVIVYRPTRRIWMDEVPPEVRSP